MGRLFDGVHTATVLPFDEKCNVDYEAYADHCLWQVDAGVQSIVANGSLGEYETLTDLERARVAEVAAEAIDGTAMLIVGVGGKSAPESCRWAEHAIQIGADAVMALPPTSHAPSAAEAVAHFKAIASVGLPVIVYNNPFSTRIDLTPNLMARIAEIDGVRGIKEFSQDSRRVRQILELTPNLEVLCGCDDVLVEAVIGGARGWIAGFVNVFPEQSVHLLNLCLMGNWATAIELYNKMLPILRWDAHPAFVQAIKMAQDICGRYGGPVRLPRLLLSDDEAMQIEKAVRQALEAG